MEHPPVNQRYQLNRKPSKNRSFCSKNVGMHHGASARQPMLSKAGGPLKIATFCAKSVGLHHGASARQSMLSKAGGPLKIATFCSKNVGMLHGASAYQSTLLKAGGLVQLLTVGFQAHGKETHPPVNLGEVAQNQRYQLNRKPRPCASVARQAAHPPHLRNKFC